MRISAGLKASNRRQICDMYHTEKLNKGIPVSDLWEVAFQSQI
jgi:hypothetical protein